MHAHLGETINRGGRSVCNYGRGIRRWWKRQTAKRRRRIARKLGNEAPRRDTFRGWAD